VSREEDDFSYTLEWRKAGQGRKERRERAKAWQAHLKQVFGAEPEKHWLLRGRRFRAFMGPWRATGSNPLLGLLLSRGGGLLPVLLLHLLAQGPRYGNELMGEIEELTRGGWVSNPGAIYPLLSLLEAEGLIEGSWETPHKRRRRFYSLTPAGKKELERLKGFLHTGLLNTLQVLEHIVEEMYAGDLSER
jgi:PadR family transcriptional regulator PadR